MWLPQRATRSRVTRGDRPRSRAAAEIHACAARSAYPGIAGMVAFSSRARGGPPPSGTRKSTRATMTGSGASKSRAIASASSPENGSSRAARSRASPEASSARASFTAPERMSCASRAAAARAARVSTSGSATSGMGSTVPSGRRTVMPPAHARSAASRPTRSSASPWKIVAIVSRGRCATRTPSIVSRP